LHNAFAESFDPLQLDNEVWTELVGKFLAKHEEHEQSVEQRVEQLEARVTDMSFDLIRTKSKCRAYEVGLEELQQVHDVNAMKDRVYHLQVLAGEHSRFILCYCLGHQSLVLNLCKCTLCSKSCLEGN